MLMQIASGPTAAMRRVMGPRGLRAKSHTMFVSSMSRRLKGPRPSPAEGCRQFPETDHLGREQGAIIKGNDATLSRLMAISCQLWHVSVNRQELATTGPAMTRL